MTPGNFGTLRPDLDEEVCVRLFSRLQVGELFLNYSVNLFNGTSETGRTGEPTFDLLPDKTRRLRDSTLEFAVHGSSKGKKVLGGQDTRRGGRLFFPKNTTLLLLSIVLLLSELLLAVDTKFKVNSHLSDGDSIT